MLRSSDEELEEVSHQILEVQPRRAPEGTGPEPVRVRLLGGFRVSVGNRDVGDEAWRLRKARGLVKLLALAEGHRLHREQVTASLWPDLYAKPAINNLHRALHFARAALGDSPENDSSRRLSLRNALVELCPDGPLWVDVEAFEGSAEAARRSREPAAYRTAIELYAGDLLPEDRYEPWTEERRADLRRLRRALLIELAYIHEERGEFSPAIEALGSAVVDEAADEEAHAALMRLLALAGRRHEALLQYERLRTALREGLNAEPDEATRLLYEQIRTTEFPPFPPPREFRSEVDPAEPPRDNLPAPLTSFVGRERQMTEVRRSLSMTRLLTLSGAGGSGKTRLAVEVSRELAGSYPDGIRLVELASLSDPELVPQTVAETFGVREQPGSSIVETLKGHIGSGQTLLIMDNCEHVVDAAASLVETLLKACPRLRILATSREALGVTGETVWPVPPLSLPAPAPEATVEGLASSEAVRLFVERAHSRLPDFELTQENAPSVAEICRRLDGIPLAIELASARMSALAVEQVAQRLEGSLKLLNAGGRRVAEERHRTMRATVAWSYELLDEQESELFRRLSVFAGGWTLEAAEEVCSGSGIEHDEVLELLTRLVDKSLVASLAGATADGEVRYRMLEPVRQYAHEMLETGDTPNASPGEAERVRKRHARYYLEVAEGAGGAERLVTESRPVAWHERMEGEHANLRAALDWSLNGDRRAPVLGLRLAVALFWFWQSHLTEGLRYLEVAVSVDDPAAIRWRARAFHGASWLAFFQGNSETSKSSIEESVALYREAGAKEGIASGLVQLGMMAVLDQRDDIPLPVVLEELGQLKPGLRNRSTLGYLLILEGLIALGAGDLQSAQSLHEESLVLLREIEDTQGIMTCLMHLGGIALMRGDYEGCTPLLRKTLRLAWETDGKLAMQITLLGMGCVAEGLGQPERAAGLWGVVEGMRDAYGVQPTPMSIYVTNYEVRVAAVLSRLGEEAFAEAWAEGKATPLERAVEYALGEDDAYPEEAIPQQHARPPSGPLTHRQREVALLIGEGFSNRRIARHIEVSERTIEAHVGNVLRKLGLRSRTEIAAWVANQGEEPWHPGDPDRRAGD